MTFWRVVFIGVVLAVISAAVIQIRLMNASASRQIHLLVSQQQKLQLQIWQQEMELAQLRAPWKVVNRLQTMGAEVTPPGAQREAGQPRAATSGPRPVPTQMMMEHSRSGGGTRKWPSQPVQNRPRNRPR